MFVKALKAIDLPTHALKPGAVVDLPKDVAMRLSKEGLVEIKENEEAIAIMAGVEIRKEAQKPEPEPVTESKAESDDRYPVGNDESKKTPRQRRRR